MLGIEWLTTKQKSPGIGLWRNVYSVYLPLFKLLSRQNIQSTILICESNFYKIDNQENFPGNT